MIVTDWSKVNVPFRTSTDKKEREWLGEQTIKGRRRIAIFLYMKIQYIKHIVVK